MSRNKIVIGGMEFLDHQLNSGSVYIANSIAGDELGIDTMDAELDCSGWARTLFRPKNSAGLMTADDLLYSVAPRFRVLTNDVTKFSYGEKVYYYHDGLLIGKFYLSTVKRVGQFFYELSCVSAIGLLDTAPHYGGLYTGEALPTVLSDIIGGTVPYTVQDAVKNIHVYGWLPVSTRRDNLRQLLFASGCALKKDTAGELNVCQLKLENPVQIDEDRLMMGGSVDYQAAATEAVVVEHGFFKASNASTETLYNDGVQGAEITSPKGKKLTGSLLTFDSPVYDLHAEGGGLLESGVNYAVLAASGLTKLTGKKYAHTTREVFAKASGGVTGEQNIARVEDATLVNAVNSDAVASRVASFYAKSRTVNMDMVMGVERPGDAVSFQDPFGDDTAALILSQDINMSGTLVASASFLAGYVPESGGVYENSRVLTGSGTYTPPSGAKRIRVVLIGGGHGGSRGENGKDGTLAGVGSWGGRAPSGWTMVTKAYNNGYAGEGGGPGQPGEGGKIYQVTINLTGGESYSYSCGAGGASASSGGNTNFGSYSSASGSTSALGYINIMTGERYAGQGKPGISGGKGSGRPRNAESGKYPVEEGETITDSSGRSWKPGASTGDSNGSFSLWDRREDKYGDVSSGASSGSAGGGGPAYGSNGNDGQNGSVGVAFGSKTSGSATARYGQGGTGASASAPPKETRYGYGGGGGNGGGGGGGGPANGASISTRDGSNATRSFYVDESYPGSGGSGSAGGTGGDGCIIIYW